MGYTNPRYVNDVGGILLEPDVEGEPETYVDAGPLYDAAVAGDFGVVAPYVPDELTAEDIIRALEQAVDTHIDSVARAKGYDSRITCALRAGYTNPWQAEGQAFGTWMDACYTYCYQVQLDVQNELRAIPTVDELIAELPEMVWP